MRQLKLCIEPLTSDRWVDLVELFSLPGASVARGCYCMYYRRSGPHKVPPGMTHSEANKRALKRLVDRGVVPGLIGYEKGRPIGWVSLGPRGDYAKLERSSVMKPIDAKPVWSIICFVVDPEARHRGVAEAMLKGALMWARKQGVTLLEAYPCDKPAKAADDSMWFGAKSMFDRAGFVEVARRKPMRPVMRKSLRSKISCLLFALATGCGAWAMSATDAAEAQPAAFQCNPVPAVNWLIAEPVGRTPQEFLALLDSDPAFRALFRDLAIRAGPPPTLIIAFPELESPFAVIQQLPQGQLQSVRWAIDEVACPFAPDRLAPVVEYYNTRLDHYFQTADPGEQAAIDRGDVGADWVRTGKSFVALLPSCPARAYSSGLEGVYRFFGVPGVGPNSHFFTASPFECKFIDLNYPGWAFEGTAFWVSAASGDACAPPGKPVYRLYNNSMGGTPNHRYTVDPDVVTTMTAAGWVLEEVAWCAN